MIFEFLIGTGFLISGHVVTANHVAPLVKGANDVAVIAGEYDGEALVPVCRKIRKGEKLTVKGYPRIDDKPVYMEIRTKMERYTNYFQPSIEMKGYAIAGFSGAPVLDKDNKVVAVVTTDIGHERILATSWCDVKSSK